MVSKGQQKASDFEMDSSYVDLDRRWSLRAYSLVKFQTIFLKNKSNNQSIRYFPGNPFGVGLGFAYRYLVIDLGINLRLDKDTEASHVDFQGSLFLRTEAFDFFVQRYRGFRGVNFSFKDEKFRDDIKTFALGFDYFHTFNGRRLSIASALQGTSIQKKSTGSFVLGGYFSLYRLASDSSIVPPSEQPNFNDRAQIHETRFTNFGIQAGYAYSLVFPRNYFFFASILPGLGFNFGAIEAGEDYRPRRAPAGKLNLRLAMGRAARQYYTIISFDMDNFLMNIGHQNRYRYSLGKIKLVVGYRMNSQLKALQRLATAGR